MTEFDSYSDDGVSVVIGVQHTEVANLGASWSRFLTVTLIWLTTIRVFEQSYSEKLSFL